MMAGGGRGWFQLGCGTFFCAEEFPGGCHNVQEAKHQATALVDIKDVLTSINRKRAMERGTWARGDAATPSGRAISRHFSFAAKELDVKLWN